MPPQQPKLAVVVCLKPDFSEKVSICNVNIKTMAQGNQIECFYSGMQKCVYIHFITNTDAMCIRRQKNKKKSLANTRDNFFLHPGNFFVLKTTQGFSSET